MTPRPSKQGEAAATTAVQVDAFERIVAQLTALHQEFSAQAKSKADNPVSKFKLKMLNEKLAAANAILDGPSRPFEDFDAFDEADMPTNSDISLVLATYIASFERWRSARVHVDSLDGWVWITSDGAKIAAAPSTQYLPGR